MELKKDFQNSDELELLKTGISDNANLLSDDELGEIFGGYQTMTECAIYIFGQCLKGYKQIIIDDDDN